MHPLLTISRVLAHEQLMRCHSVKMVCLLTGKQNNLYHYMELPYEKDIWKTDKTDSENT
jgi:hypothetical protein